MSKMPVDDKVSKDYKIERLFLRYAYPCVDQRTKISEEEKISIKEGILSGKRYSREDIERFFPHAFEKMKLIYPNEDSWLHVEDFWRGEGHNNSLELDHENMNETMKEFCRVKTGIVKKNYGEYLELGDGKKVLNPFRLELKEGDMIRIHQACVIEKV